jgi:hypothetical protein
MNKLWAATARQSPWPNRNFYAAAEFELEKLK